MAPEEGKSSGKKEKIHMARQLQVPVWEFVEI